MAENIVQGLFGLTPAQVEQQQYARNADYAEKIANMDGFQAAKMGIGQGAAGLGQITAGMMGMVNPQVEEAKRRQAVMGMGGDLSTVEGIKAKAQQFIEAGDQKMAMQLIMLARQQEVEESKLKLESANTHKAMVTADELPKMRHEETLARLAQQAEAAKQRSEDARASIQQRAEAAREATAARLEIAKLVHSLKASSSSDKTHQITGNDGVVRVYDKDFNLIKELGNVGKPTGTFEKNAVAQKKMQSDLATMIPDLTDISKDGGLIDQSTGSGVGSAIDFAARAVGQAMPGDIAVGRLRPIVDKVLKLVPRFEGPQSDKDTKSYQQAAGDLANPNVPNPIKKAAAKEILRIYKDRQAQFVTKDFEASGAETSAPTSTQPSNRIKFDAQGNMVKP